MRFFCSVNVRVVSITSVLILCGVLLPASPAQTVTTGEVTGTATDATNAVVSNAAVILKSVDSGETRAVVSSGTGLYRFTFVRPGSYDLSASSAGLRSDIARIVVGLGQVQTMNLVMKIEEPTRSVTVSDSASLLDTDNAQTIYRLTERQIEQLPLPGGDLVGVAYSAPGAVIANRYGTNGNFVFQGIGGVSNLFTVNGIDDMDPYWNLNNSGTTGMLLGANEIQEVSVIQNAYEGQYGRQAGTQVSFVSKSGSNTYHGNLSENYNSSFLNAKDYFNHLPGSKMPHMVSNQYAASLGGRIIRDKLFFFVDTESLRYATPGGTSVMAVPSKALEQYTLNTIQPSQAAIYKQAFAAFDSAPGRSNAIPVVNGTGLLQDSSGRLGCGFLSGTATGSGGTFGKDVSCSDAYSSLIARDNAEWLASSRVDYNLSNRQRMFFRFKTDHGLLPVNTSPINPVFNAISSQPDYENQLNYTFAITPRLANNFTGAFTYFSYEFDLADLAGALKAFPLRFNIFDGGANGSFGRLTPVGAPATYPQGHRAANWQLVDDLSYSVGNHFLKAGVNYRFTREADLQYLSTSQIPRYTFTRLGDFASGVVGPRSSYVQNFPTNPVIHLSLYNLAFYGQDEWAVTSHLKLIATVRLDRNGNPYCLERCFSRLTSPFADLPKGASIPYNQSIQTGLSHSFYAVDPIVAQPRFSFAYSPAWAKGTVVRGGIGLLTDLYPAFFANTLAGNPPNVFLAGIHTGLVNVGGAGSAPAIAAASVNAFRNTFASGATLAQLQKAVAPVTFNAPFFSSMPSTLHTPRFAEWSLDVEHQIGRNNVLTVSYKGNHGYDLLFQDTMNGYDSGGFGGLPVSAPDPRFGLINQITNESYSNYHGMTVQLRRTMSSSLQGQISYTWSHALDLVSNGGLLGFNYDSYEAGIDPLQSRRLNYSNADYDQRHNLALDFVWNVPTILHNRVAKSILGGWSVAGKTNAYTGTPFSVYDGQLGYTVLAEVTDPNISRSCGHSALTTPCFNPSQFASPATQMTYGNVRRNWFRGPGYFNVDSSLYKTIAIHERTRFTIGASAFNLFNHPDLVIPANDVSGSSFGLITFSGGAPSTPYGLYGTGGLAGRIVTINAKLAF